tara:strand:- start:1011 stop:1136 length:126 start_codon:yes stop_codon:yes gene_type:complete
MLEFIFWAVVVMGVATIVVNHFKPDWVAMVVNKIKPVKKKK